MYLTGEGGKVKFTLSIVFILFINTNFI